MRIIVEAVNKVVKYRYLFRKNLPDGEALGKAVAESVVDYNDIRPHGSLDGLTPSEAYSGLGKQSLHAHEKLKAVRIEQNKNLGIRRFRTDAMAARISSKPNQKTTPVQLFLWFCSADTLDHYLIWTITSLAGKYVLWDSQSNQLSVVEFHHQVQYHRDKKEQLH